MTFRVIISDEALTQAKQHLLHIARQEQSLLPAQRWWDKALAKVLSLESFPKRCPLAPENEWCEEELRVLVVDRCLFIYHVDEANRIVWIVKFHHGSQEPRR